MIKFNQVTWYSKLLAIIFFIGVLPAWTFYLGKQYGEVVTLHTPAVLQNSSLQDKNKPSVLVGMNTYVNTQTGASISYPSDWVMSEGVLQNGVKEFCPHSLSDGWTCNMKNNAPHMPDTLAPILLFKYASGTSPSLNPAVMLLGKDIEGNLYELELANPQYEEVYKEMIDSFKFLTNTPLSYRNARAGFSLEFPTSWKGYIYREYSTGSAFGLKDQDVIFSLDIMTKKEYDECKSGALCPVDLITMDGDRYFVASYSQDITDQVRKAHIENPSDIISTLKIIK